MLQAGALDGELAPSSASCSVARRNDIGSFSGCRKSRELTIDARSDIRRMGDTPARPPRPSKASRCGPGRPSYSLAARWRSGATSSATADPGGRSDATPRRGQPRDNDLPFHTLQPPCRDEVDPSTRRARRRAGTTTGRAARRGQERRSARGSRQAAARRGRGRDGGARRGLDVGRRRASQLVLCGERRLVKLDLEAEIELEQVSRKEFMSAYAGDASESVGRRRRPGRPREGCGAER